MNEIAEWIDFFVRNIPGNIGIRLRNQYYHNKFASCGKWVLLQENVIIRGRENLHLGNNCCFSYNVFLSAKGGIKIGDNVLIGPSSKIYSDNHIHSNPEELITNQGWEYKEVTIDDDVWIGADCFIKPGVHIGKSAVISAGSVVFKSLPPFSISAGNPARVVGWRKNPPQETSER